QVIGTGPFKWSEFTPGTGVKLVRNPNYWQAGLPYLDGVELRVIPQPQSMLLALQAEQIHVALGLSEGDLSPIKNNTKFSVAPSQDYYLNFCLTGNVKVDPIGRKEFRQAVAWAIDRERIYKDVFNSLGFVSSLPWSKESPGYDQVQSNYYKYDPA